MGNKMTAAKAFTDYLEWLEDNLPNLSADVNHYESAEVFRKAAPDLFFDGFRDWLWIRGLDAFFWSVDAIRAEYDRVGR